MKLPAMSDFVREALIKLGGALIAAWVIGQLPPVKKWIQAQWGNTGS